MCKPFVLAVLILLSACSSTDVQEPGMTIVQNPAYGEVTLPVGKPIDRIAESYNLMFEKYNPFYQNISLQISKYIRHIYQDRSGAMWFGTNEDGIARMQKDRLDYFTPEQGLGGRAVRGIAADTQDRLWVATNGGVSLLSDGKFENMTVADGLPSNEVWSLFIDSKGRVWAGTIEGLAYCDAASVKEGRAVFTKLELPKTQEHSSSRFSYKLVWAIYEDQAGALWFGTDGDGVKKFDGKQIQNFGGKEGLSCNNVLSIVQDNNQQMWFSTWGGGLNKFDGRSFTHFDDKSGLSSNNVWSSLKDKDGNLWFGTLGGGINKFDGQKFSVYREKQGLTQNHVQSILQDKDGKMWFGFSGGVFVLDENFLRNIKKPGC